MTCRMIGSVLLVVLTAVGAVHGQEVTAALPAMQGDQNAPTDQRESLGSAVYSPFTSEARLDRAMVAPVKTPPASEPPPGLAMTLVAGVACGAALVWLLRL